VALVNKDATVIKLAMNYAEVDKAKTIINKLVQVYNQDAIEDKNTEFRNTAKFIAERIEQIGKDLGDVENQKERFKQSNQISDLETEVKLGCRQMRKLKVKSWKLMHSLN
jgi:uncharacterized protein involved in exopolysaccharide biosynthesis